METRKKEDCANYGRAKCGHELGFPCDGCQNWKEKRYTFTRH